MPDSSETPQGPYLGNLESDPDFEQFLANLKPDDTVTGIPAETYKEYVERHQALMTELAAEADPVPILERWDAMIEELRERNDSGGAEGWETAKFGVCLWLYRRPGFDHRDLAIERARSIHHPVHLMEALILMNDGEDKRGLNYLGLLTTDPKVHPYERELMLSALRQTAQESQLVGAAAELLLEPIEAEVAKQESQKAASEKERLELAAAELGVPAEQIEVDRRRYGKLDIEYTRVDGERLPDDHPARPLFAEFGFTGVQVSVYEKQEFDHDKGERGGWVDRRHHAVRLIQRRVRRIESAAVDLSRAEEVLETADQTLLERLDDGAWQAVQTSGRPRGRLGDGWRSWGQSLEDSASNALRYRDSMYREHRWHAVADVSDALTPDVADAADRFFEFSDQAARRLLEPKAGQ